MDDPQITQIYADGEKGQREWLPVAHSSSLLCENLRNLRIELVFSIRVARG